MSRLVHVNLLLDDERRGHSPIRARVMVPMFSILALAGVGVWAGLSLLSNAMLASGNARAEAQIAEQVQTVKRYESVVARKTALESENDQLDAFLRGRVLFGPALAAAALAGAVGYLALRTVVRVLERGAFWMFGPYCIAVGALALVLS